MTTLEERLSPHFMPQEDANSSSFSVVAKDISNQTNTFFKVDNVTNFETFNKSSSAFNCTSPLDNVNFEDPRILGSLLPLGMVCLMVILGNIMVIVAVKITHKLRGATNLFIVSLAWADLMLGIIVLPFSAMYEVFKMWLFGKVWCSIWLAVDVWMCTASILHLVVISLDRYIAVTHPITYPNLMTSKKAKLLIAGAWILSFVICFPPLVGWNDKGDGSGSDLFDINDNVVHGDPADQEIADRCNPQCQLNQEPGYVIYSAVGSFYAPMLVMMFFNWRIYRTATKTTKAIRQGWTKVKGVSGDEEGGLGIHRGGGASSSYLKSGKPNGSSTKSGGSSSRRTSSRRPSNAFIGNGITPKDVEKVAELASKSSKSNGLGGGPKGPCYRSKLLPPPPANNCGTIPRSASSSQMVSNSKAAGETLGLKSPSHQSFLSTNSHSNKHIGPRAKSLMHSRSKSIANVTHVRSHSNLIHKSTNNANNPPSSPRVSHHQPCPNHVAGKTFAEMGTQTLPKPNRKRSQSLEEIGCVASLKKRLRLNQSDPSCTESDTDDPDKMSIGSTHPKPTSCFRCHPRRWRHQACCFRRAVTSKAGHHQAHNHNATSIKSSFKPKIITTQSQDGDGISDPGSLLNASTDELQVHPMGGVASMISSVVSQTASVAATTAGSKVPTKSTFGRRNIKNQVRRFRMETKAAKTLGIIVGCFICCWFPFFTMYLVTAFCHECIPDLAFSIIFWLGYCNSAINPFIYAAFSRDFRGAFKKIICKVFCRHVEEPPRGIFMALHPRNVTLGAAAVAMAGANSVANNTAVGGQSSSN